MHDNNNTHAHAASAYGNIASGGDSRTLQGTVLLKSAQMMEDLASRLKDGGSVSRDEIGDTLDHNSKLWQLFVDTMKDTDHPMPQDVRENVLSLALFVFKRTNEIYLDTKAEKLGVLININRNIAAGLMKQAVSASAVNASAKS